MEVMISSWVMARQSSAPLRSFRRNMLSPMPDQRPDSSQTSAGVQGGQEKLLPDGVHLLADDRDDLVDGPVAEEQVAVDACAELADIAGAQQQFVARDFGVGRSFAQGRDEELGPAMHVVGRRLSSEDAGPGAGKAG